MNSPFYVGCWLVEPLLNRISTNGEVVHLEPKVMQALLHLSEHAGSVVQKSDLLKAVWPDAFVTDDVMTRCIFELRKALRDNSRNPRYICTVHKQYCRLANSQGVGRAGIKRTLVTSLVARRSLYRGAVVR
jgi:DNA-binding winged helix-turn-helix (wHTH) protein